jgi:ribonuclease HI
MPKKNQSSTGQDHGKRKPLENRGLIYCDGACRGNPGPGGWGGIIYQPTQDKVLEIGGGHPQTTNNQMELLGAIETLKIFQDPIPITIHTDSMYVIQGITDWHISWERNGWKNSQGKTVLNLALWQELIQQTRRLGAIHWKYVPGHKGVPGNERADEIAKDFATLSPQKNLYSGPHKTYPHPDIFSYLK